MCANGFEFRTLLLAFSNAIYSLLSLAFSLFFIADFRVLNTHLASQQIVRRLSSLPSYSTLLLFLLVKSEVAGSLSGKP